MLMKAVLIGDVLLLGWSGFAFWANLAAGSFVMAGVWFLLIPIGLWALGKDLLINLAMALGTNTTLEEAEKRFRSGIRDAEYQTAS